MKLDLRKIYRFEPVPAAAGALPVGGDIYYECQQCHEIVSSTPHLKVACACGNLAGGEGRLSVRSPELVSALRGRLK